MYVRCAVCTIYVLENDYKIHIHTVNNTPHSMYITYIVHTHCVYCMHTINACIHTINACIQWFIVCIQYTQCTPYRHPISFTCLFYCAYTATQSDTLYLSLVSFIVHTLCVLYAQCMWYTLSEVWNTLSEVWNTLSEVYCWQCGCSFCNLLLFMI